MTNTLSHWDTMWNQSPHHDDGDKSSGSNTHSSGGGEMSSDSREEYELPIIVGGCEKWVTGLTRRTTCDDILYALLSYEGNPNVSFDIQGYAIFEGWRGVDRPLKGRTKILKVWKTWGTERHEVKFYVRKVSDMCMDTNSEIYRPRRSRKSHKDRERERTKESRKERKSREHSHRHDREKHKSKDSKEGRRHYQKDSSTEKLNGESDPCKSKAFHQLVHIIIDQEKRIQEQLTRLKETDVQIENYETKVHVERTKTNGQNYVQEAYLRDKSEESSSSDDLLFPSIKANDMEAYLHMCQNILGLEDKIVKEKETIEDLSIQIQEESVIESPSITAEQSTEVLDQTLTHLNEEQLLIELSKLRKEFEDCATLSGTQAGQIHLVNDTLTECEEDILKKQKQLEDLENEIEYFEKLESESEKESLKQNNEESVTEQIQNKQNDKDQSQTYSSQSNGQNETNTQQQNSQSHNELVAKNNKLPPPPYPGKPSVLMTSQNGQKTEGNTSKQNKTPYHWILTRHSEYLASCPNGTNSYDSNQQQNQTRGRAVSTEQRHIGAGERRSRSLSKGRAVQQQSRSLTREDFPSQQNTDSVRYSVPPQVQFKSYNEQVTSQGYAHHQSIPQLNDSKYYTHIHTEGNQQTVHKYPPPPQQPPPLPPHQKRPPKQAPPYHQRQQFNPSSQSEQWKSYNGMPSTRTNSHSELKSCLKDRSNGTFQKLTSSSSVDYIENYNQHRTMSNSSLQPLKNDTLQYNYLQPNNQHNTSSGYSSLSSEQYSPKGNMFDNDSNSDTGLSSLHSDESAAPLETLV